MPSSATRARVLALLAVALGSAHSAALPSSNGLHAQALWTQGERVLQASPSTQDWRSARADAAAGRVEGAGFLLVHLQASSRQADDARLALDGLFAAGSDRTRLLMAAFRVATPEALVGALDVARAGTSERERWASQLAFAAHADSRFDDVAAFAAAGAARFGADDQDAALEAFRALALRSGPAASAARRQAFELLDQRHRERLREWISDWSSLGPAAPPHPIVEAWPAMEELEELGEGRATWWLWLAASQLEESSDERAQRRTRLSARLRDHIDSPWFVDVARGAATAVTPQTRAELLALLEHATASTSNASVRPWCLHGMATIVGTTEPIDHARAATLFERLAEEHASHPLAPSARVEVWVLRNLLLGMPLPLFDRPDVVGRTVDLAARRGRIVVLVFLETGDDADAELLSVLDQLSLLHPRDRFEVVAVSVDTDVDEARQRHVASRREWEVSWQGSRAGPWPSAFGLRSFPATFVIDEAGTIRARDVYGAALSRAVFDLIGARTRGG